MSIVSTMISANQVKKTGITRARVKYQLSHEELTEQTLNRREGVLNDTGALVINTGEFTGRCPKDKFIVKDEITDKIVNWNEFNIPIELKYFDIIYRKIIYYIDRLPDLWIRDCYACADEKFRLN